MLYQLTIDSSRTGTAVSGHGTPAAARAELHRYAVDADVYYQLIQATPPHSSYDLIELTDRTRTTGCAVIEEMSMAAEALYYRAGEARRWISEHRADSTGHPARVLAHARATTTPAATRILLQEAAFLAGLDRAPDIAPAVLDTLHHQSRTPARSLSAVELAALVADTTTNPSDAATLTWWLALLTWGGSAA